MIEINIMNSERYLKRKHHPEILKKKRNPII